MIPKAHITHWAAGAPWPNELRVEQDLILSRLISRGDRAVPRPRAPVLRGGQPVVRRPRGGRDVRARRADGHQAARYQRRKGRALFDLWHVLWSRWTPTTRGSSPASSTTCATMSSPIRSSRRTSGPRSRTPASPPTSTPGHDATRGLRAARQRQAHPSSPDREELLEGETDRRVHGGDVGMRWVEPTVAPEASARFSFSVPEHPSATPAFRRWLARERRRVMRMIGVCREGWRGPESNRRHHDFQSCALPTELPRRARGC